MSRRCTPKGHRLDKSIVEESVVGQQVGGWAWWCCGRHSQNSNANQDLVCLPLYHTRSESDFVVVGEVRGSLADFVKPKKAGARPLLYLCWMWLFVDHYTHSGRQGHIFTRLLIPTHTHTTTTTKHRQSGSSLASPPLPACSCSFSLLR